MINKCRDGSASWLKDLRPYQPEQLRRQIYQAVFSGENGDPQLILKDAGSVMYVDGGWLTQAELRQDVLNVIEIMIHEMTSLDFVPSEMQGPAHPPENEASAEDVQTSLKHEKAPVLRGPTQHSPSELEYEQVAGPVDAQHTSILHPDNLEVHCHPQLLPPVEGHGTRYAMSCTEDRESERYGQCSSSELQEQPIDTHIGPTYHRQRINVTPQRMVADTSHSQVPPGLLNNVGQYTMSQWNTQGFGTVPHYPGLRNVPANPPFACYIPYPMVHPMQAGYPIYGRPQYHTTFIQPPVSQQQHLTSQGFPSISALGVNASSRTMFISEPGQEASTFQRQHLETQRVSSNYHVGTNSRNVEWPSRIGRQGSVQPLLPLLPYRQGADDMCPKKVGGASVRLQELTRNGKPSYAMATSKDIIPFSETAKNTKPAEWGVVKIGNVSKT